MASVDYPQLADQILEGVGGPENVRDATHCATRLRLKLKDDSKASKEQVEKLPGVITVVQAGGQFQVVVGNDVPKVHAPFVARLPQDEGGSVASSADEKPEQKGSLLDRFIQLISALINPLIWPLAGAGLLKAFATLLVTLGWMDSEGTTYIIINAAGDGIFYFLPLFLAVTAARRFGANQFIAMALAGALVHPTLVALVETEAPVTFAGIPVVMMSYANSVIPIIISVWVLSYLERFLDRILPSTIRNFSKPLLALLIMVPLVLMTIGPITTYAAQAVAWLVSSLYEVAPWLGGALVGGLWQIFVIFGLHWGLVPVLLNDLATTGQSVMMASIMPAVLAQGAATLAVLVRSRSAARRQAAGPAALSGLLAGITEPAIYGVNLPLKRPLYFGIAGGAIGGIIVGVSGSAASSFIFPSLLALPAFLQFGSFAGLLLGCGVAMAIAFVLTFLFVDRETPGTASSAVAPPEDETAPEPGTPTGAQPELAAPGAASASTGGATAAAGASSTATADAAEAAPTSEQGPAAPVVVDVVSPMAGEVMVLGDVSDAAFAAEALGKGVGIVPGESIVRAPVSGKLISVAGSKHAYGLKSDDGVEVLVHVGIDTVELKGEHFSTECSRGERIQAGDPLVEVDFDAVAAAGYDTTVILTVTNTKKHAEVLPAQAGPVAAGDPVVVVKR